MSVASQDHADKSCERTAHRRAAEPKAEAKPQPRRSRARWTGLHEALAQLKEARELARAGTLNDIEENAQ